MPFGATQDLQLSSAESFPSVCRLPCVSANKSRLPAQRCCSKSPERLETLDRGSIAGPPTPPGHHPCLGTARAARCRSSQGHRHEYYNYILNEIPKFPFIYIPTLPSSFPLFVPRISTDFTGNSMKVIRSPLRLASKSTCPDDGR